MGTLSYPIMIKNDLLHFVVWFDLAVLKFCIANPLFTSRSVAVAIYPVTVLRKGISLAPLNNGFHNYLW
jgi:hypothetical protein